MGIVITTSTDGLSFSIDLGGLSSDRKKARIKVGDIRSVTQSTDNATVEIVFSNGEIQGFPYTIVDEIDGDTNITTQDILFDKMEAIIFVT